MKNIQIVDGAQNCSYSIFAATDEEFALIFPDPEQDIEFIDAVWNRLGEQAGIRLFTPIWDRPVIKKEVQGIHGTLFYQCEYKRRYYPNKKEADLFDPLIQATSLPPA